MTLIGPPFDLSWPQPDLPSTFPDLNQTSLRSFMTLIGPPFDLSWPQPDLPSTFPDLNRTSLRSFLTSTRPPFDLSWPQPDLPSIFHDLNRTSLRSFMTLIGPPFVNEMPNTCSVCTQTTPRQDSHFLHIYFDTPLFPVKNKKIVLSCGWVQTSMSILCTIHVKRLIAVKTIFLMQ